MSTNYVLCNTAAEKKLKTKLNDVAMNVAMAAALTDKIVTCHSR